MTISRTITVAGGVFAPGRLGELTQVLPFDLVDVVLEETVTQIAPRQSGFRAGR
jgi:hypothetical protein